MSRQRDVLERALAIKERELGPEHREVAVILASLGNAYADLGDVARARDLQERARAIQEREFGPEHREVVVTLTNQPRVANFGHHLLELVLSDQW